MSVSVSREGGRREQMRKGKDRRVEKRKEWRESKGRINRQNRVGYS